MADNPYDPERLKQWTTASLVIQLSRFAVNGTKTVDRPDAERVAAELNARIPPRVMPTEGT